MHCIDGDDPDLASSPGDGSGLHRLGSPFGASPSGMRSRTLGQVHWELSHIDPTISSQPHLLACALSDNVMAKCPGHSLQAISRGSRGLSGLARRSGSIGRSRSLGEASPRPKPLHLEMEVIAIGVGLRFVELEEGKQVSASITNSEADIQPLQLHTMHAETVMVKEWII